MLAEEVPVEERGVFADGDDLGGSILGDDAEVCLDLGEGGLEEQVVLRAGLIGPDLRGLRVGEQIGEDERVGYCCHFCLFFWVLILLFFRGWMDGWMALCLLDESLYSQLVFLFGRMLVAAGLPDLIDSFGACATTSAKVARCRVLDGGGPWYIRMMSLSTFS